MRIGIISNNEYFIPFAYTLINQGLTVQLYYAASQDKFVNEKSLAFAEQLKINTTTEKHPSNLYKWFADGKFDVCFMLGYTHLIDTDKLKQYTTKFYNIHFGLLPAFRGPVPVFWQLKSGAEKIGFAIHEVSKKFDAGNIIWLKEVPNLPHYNYELVNQLFGQLCVEGVIYILRFLINKLPVPVIDCSKQPTAYHKRPGLQDVLINWQTMSSIEICNLVRACNAWNKGAVSFYKGQELKLMDAQIINTDYVLEDNITAGTIVNNEKIAHIICADKKIIAVNMFYFNSFFLPAYQIKLFGFAKGQQLG